jgi:microcompartment protein CcmK/EutM
VRIGIVRGTVVLSVAAPALRGTALLMVEPVTAANLEARNGAGGGVPLVVASHLSPGTGEMIALVEGYCSLLVREYEFRPPGAEAAPGVEGQR